MAKIKVITGLNVKGYDFTYTMGPVNMIVGNNGTGKTARLAALRIAILGHEPKLGVQGAATYQLAGAATSSMGIAIQTDAGNAEHKWTMKGGKVSANEHLDASFARLRESVPIVMLDSREFFGLKTSDSRSKFIFSSYKIGDGASSPTSLITKLKAITLEGQTDAHTEALQEIVDQVMDSARNRTRALNENEDCPLQQWLTDQHASIKGTASNAKGNYERMVKSVEATTQHQGAEQQQVYRPIETLKEELAKLQALGEQLAGELKTLMHRQADAAEKTKRRAELNEAFAKLHTVTQEEYALAGPELEKAKAEKSEQDLLIGRLQSELAQLDKQIAERTRLQSEIESKTAEMETLKFDQGIYDAGKARIIAMEKELQTTSDTPRITAIIQKHTENLTRLGKESDQLQKDLKTFQLKADEILTKDKCPTCNQAGHEWKESYTRARILAVDKMETLITAVGIQITNTQALKEGATEALTESVALDGEQLKTKQALEGIKREVASMETARERLTLLNNTVQVLTKTLADLGEPSQKKKDAEVIYDKARTDRGYMLQRIEKAESQIKAWQSRQEIETRVKDLGEDAPVDYPPLIQAIRTRQDERMATYRTTEMELQKATEAQQDELRKAQSNAEMEKAKARVEIAKACLKVIEQFQKEVVEGVFKTLITRANSLVGPILPAPLEYRDGQIGWQRENLFVTEKTFCGLEEVMTFVAFSLALSPNSPFKLVILDEMGMLSQANRLLLIGQMVLMTKEGIVDQFVGADCEDLYSAIPGVNVIKTT